MSTDKEKVTWDPSYEAHVSEIQVIPYAHLLPMLPDMCRLFEPSDSENTCKRCGRGIQDHDGAIQTFTVTREEMHKLWPELAEKDES
ncbi:MAG: hypothetical protein ABR949_10155 [Candidatus Aquilonibacter sp.]|jgi:hypothetical protein